MKLLAAKIKRYLRVYYYSARVSVMNVLIYRSNSLLMGLAPVIWAFTFVIFLSVIFKEQKELGGWNHLELIFLLGVQEIIFMSTWMTVIKNLQEFSEWVRLGKFDLILLRPLNHRFWVSFNSVDITGILGLINALAITVFSLFKLKIQFIPGRFFFFLVGLIIAYSLVYFLAFIFSALSFFLIKSEIFHNLLLELWDFSRYPASIYDNWFRIFLLFFIPVLFFSYVPSAILLGKISWSYDFLGILLTLLLYFISTILWRKGLRRYQGASG